MLLLLKKGCKARNLLRNKIQSVEDVKGKEIGML